MRRWSCTAAVTLGMAVLVGCTGPGGDRDAEVERLIALGATRADGGQCEGGVALADPDGNELCVLDAPR